MFKFNLKLELKQMNLLNYKIRNICSLIVLLLFSNCKKNDTLITCIREDKKINRCMDGILKVENRHGVTHYSTNIWDSLVNLGDFDDDFDLLSGKEYNEIGHFIINAITLKKSSKKYVFDVDDGYINDEFELKLSNISLKEIKRRKAKKVKNLFVYNVIFNVDIEAKFFDNDGFLEENNSSKKFQIDFYATIYSIKDLDYLR